MMRKIIRKGETPVISIDKVDKDRPIFVKFGETIKWVGMVVFKPDVCFTIGVDGELIGGSYTTFEELFNVLSEDFTFHQEV